MNREVPKGVVGYMVFVRTSPFTARPALMGTPSTPLSPRTLPFHIRYCTEQVHKPERHGNQVGCREISGQGVRRRECRLWVGRALVLLLSRVWVGRPKREMHLPPPKDLPYADVPKRRRRMVKNDVSNEQLQYRGKILDQLGQKLHTSIVVLSAEPVGTSQVISLPFQS